MDHLISSTSNPIIKRVRSLGERKNRKREGAFIVEGMQPVWRAVESGWQVETLLIAPALLTSNAALDMANDLRSRGSRVLTLERSLFERLSEREGPAGVMAIVRSQTTSLASARVGTDDLWVILHRVHNPGNLGTIIRTADAAGCSGIVLTGDCTDPFAPVAVKASMGSLFALPLVVEPDVDRVLAWAQRAGIDLVATSGTASEAHWNANWERPVGILLGNEGDGLPAELIERADRTVRIPMTGTAESLNLGVAAALMIYEAQRNRLV